MTEPRRLTRSDDAILAGVCGGIAEYLGISPTRARIAYVALSILSAGFPGMLVYVILWFVLPRVQPKFRLEDFRAG